MVRRVLLVVLFGSAVVLVPWTGYLALSLPDKFRTHEWRVAWVGFDLALIGCFALSWWWGSRRHRGAVPLLAATAALLCCDAWFDVLLDWSRKDWWVSLCAALLVELPTAALLVLRARALLAGGMPHRPLTAQDVQWGADEEIQQLLRDVGAGQVHAASLADPRIVERLTKLARAGYVRKDRDGHWRLAQQNLRLPDLAGVPEDQRPAVAAYVAAKFDREVRLLSWAAEHRDEFGPWGCGERAVANLTSAELAAFDAEYRDLATRYCLLRDTPAAGTRPVAIRFYAFPAPAQLPGD